MFLAENIFGGKYSGNIFGRKYFWQKIFLAENIIGGKYFWWEILLAGNIFGGKHFWQEIFLEGSIQEIFLVGNICGGKYFLHQTFWHNIILETPILFHASKFVYRIDPLFQSAKFCHRGRDKLEYGRVTKTCLEYQTKWSPVSFPEWEKLEKENFCSKYS